jgi:hypothetical protein
MINCMDICVNVGKLGSKRIPLHLTIGSTSTPNIKLTIVTLNSPTISALV